MFRGRLGSWGSLALLVALAGAAAGLSLATAPRTPLAPFANDPDAASFLNQAVEGTLHATSFVATVTFRGVGKAQRIPPTTLIYESPNRTQSTTNGRTEITIGNVQYLSNVFGSAVPSQRPWLATRLSPKDTGLNLISPNLDNLANAAAIRRSGDRYRAFEEKWVPPAPAPFHDPGGWAVITATAVVVHGRIFREDLKVLAFPISNHLSEETVTFTDYGTAPPVNPPPVSEVEHTTCGSIRTSSLPANGLGGSRAAQVTRRRRCRSAP